LLIVSAFKLYYLHKQEVITVHLILRRSGVAYSSAQ